MSRRLKYDDNTAPKTAGLRHITKPVFKQLKDTIYDIRSDDPIFGYAPITFDEDEEHIKGWMLLYNDIKKNIKGYSHNLQIKSILDANESEQK